MELSEIDVDRSCMGEVEIGVEGNGSSTDSASAKEMLDAIFARAADEGVGDRMVTGESPLLSGPSSQGHAHTAWPRDELLVCMLGTGCAVPSKHRAPAAIYLHAFKRGGLLLDAGEGTLGQLQALFGVEETTCILQRLQCIWISHHHADHHLGLLRLIAAASAVRERTAAQPLLVIGPRAVGTFLNSYAARLQSAGPAAPLRFHFEACANFNAPRSGARDFLLRRSSLGLRAISCVPVIHCADAWGLVVEHAAGWKVVYSGDTRPCEALVQAGRHATLLIHEATFDDERGADAAQKRHSTRGEALDVGARMGAQHTILTHLSQRYKELHETQQQQQQGGEKGRRRWRMRRGPAVWCCRLSARSSMVFDLMAINLSDLGYMTHFHRTLGHFFECDQVHQRCEREAAAQAEEDKMRARTEAERGATNKTCVRT